MGGMKEEWRTDPVQAYHENARYLYGYPESTIAEYVRDVERFARWLVVIGRFWRSFVSSSDDLPFH